MAFKQCKAGEWVKMGQVVYKVAEDEEVWVGMVGGDWQGQGEEELKEENPPPPRSRTTSPPNPGHQNWWQENIQNAF